MIMQSHRKSSGALTAAVLLSFLATLFSIPSTARPAEKIRIAFSSISGNQIPAWVAQEKEFFRKNGLDVELVFIEGGARAVNALVSGEVAFSQMAGSSVLQSNLQGLDVVMIAGFLNTMDYQLMVHQSITQPDLLKKKTLAVSRFGSSSDFATRYVLDKYGLAPGKDVTILEIGSQPARFAALEAGKIQGAMVAVPLTLKAKSMGFHVLADLQMLGLEYQHTALVTTRSLIKSKPDLVRNTLRAFVEGIHYYKTHREEALAILRKYLRDSDPDALEETYETIGLTLIPEKPYPTLRGIQIMLRELARTEPKARTARPEQFVEMGFVRELDRSGFIDRLYKSTPVVASRQGSRPGPAPVDVKERSEPGKEETRLLAEKKKLASKNGPAPLEKARSKPAAADSMGAPGSSESLEYTIKAGDSLSRLAERFYGAQWRWGRIYAANRQTIKNPHYVYIGQKIVIPSAEAPGEERMELSRRRESQ